MFKIDFLVFIATPEAIDNLQQVLLRVCLVLLYQSMKDELRTFSISVGSDSGLPWWVCPFIANRLSGQQCAHLWHIRQFNWYLQISSTNVLKVWYRILVLHTAWKLTFPFILHLYHTCEHRLCGLRELILVHTALLTRVRTWTQVCMGLKLCLCSTTLLSQLWALEGERDGEGSWRRREGKD